LSLVVKALFYTASVSFLVSQREDRVPSLRRTATFFDKEEVPVEKQAVVRTLPEAVKVSRAMVYPHFRAIGANGLLRFYFPKGTDLNAVSEKDLAQVVRTLNNRPRKCLNYQTPQEVFSQARCGAL
jgi:hypothetical protein